MITGINASSKSFICFFLIISFLKFRVLRTKQGPCDNPLQELRSFEVLLHSISTLNYNEVLRFVPVYRHYQDKAMQPEHNSQICLHGIDIFSGQPIFLPYHMAIATPTFAALYDLV